MPGHNDARDGRLRGIEADSGDGRGTGDTAPGRREDRHDHRPRADQKRDAGIPGPVRRICSEASGQSASAGAVTCAGTDLTAWTSRSGGRILAIPERGFSGALRDTMTRVAV